MRKNQRCPMCNRRRKKAHEKTVRGAGVKYVRDHTSPISVSIGLGVMVPIGRIVTQGHGELCKCCVWGDGQCKYSRRRIHAIEQAMDTLNKGVQIDAARALLLVKT